MVKPVFLLSILLVALSAPANLVAQTPSAQPQRHAPLFQEIEQAWQQGEITVDEQILQKFYATLEPEKVMERFQHVSADFQVRCFTPLLMEYEQTRVELRPSTREEIEAMSHDICSRPSTEFSYTTPSGRFRFHYDLDGPDAVPSEAFVLEAAFAADSSWNHLVGTLGFADPVLIPQISPYEVYFKDFNPYGVTCATLGTTHIVVNNSFEGFPPNQHPQGDQIGALYVTIAHEVKHASQYATNNWLGDAGSFNWAEMDAVMVEEELFDDVNDYYHYLKADGLNGFEPRSESIFGNPGNPVPGAYWHVTWMLYFAETLGMEFWVDVWDRFRVEASKPFLDAMNRSLESFGEEFGGHHLQNLLWHLASGPNYAAGVAGFSEREFYPNPLFLRTFTHVPDSLTTPRTVAPLAANFHRVRPSGEIFGQVQITADYDMPETGVGLVAYFNDGSSDMEWLTGSGQGTEMLTSWQWRDIRELGIAVVNHSETESTSYQLQVENVIPRQISLSENYPNPFHSTTHIVFGIDRPGNVTLRVYDLLGRRVETVIDRFFEAGFHEVEFDGGGLASGVYLYQLIADGESRSRKMLLIR